MNDLTKGNMKPAFFRTPVHCVKIGKDGLLYVCDRGNNRVQVFNGRDPNLGQECRNPAGETGKCGFVKEQFVSVNTNGLPGSAVSMNFSTDAKQSCLYVGDNSNMTIYVLKRDTLEELGRLGRSGREAGEFHWLHQVSLDSRGNIYTAEVDTGKRLQKFVRYGDEGLQRHRPDDCRRRAAIATLRGLLIPRVGPPRGTPSFDGCVPFAVHREVHAAEQ